MCGIMGYYCFGSNLPDKEKIKEMFILLEARGRDASGFAFLKDNNLKVCKAPIRATELIKTDDWKSLTLPKVMIFHTRMKTQGTEKNNKNNHPLFSKDGIAIVHNGIIHNDWEIFGKKQRDAEVDSEALLSLLTGGRKEDKIKLLFKKIEGSFALAVINKAEPDRLILVKKDNPLDLYYDSSNDIIYFCSEREIMQQALDIKNFTRRGFNLGEGDFHFYEVENNYAIIINKQGVESYQKYKPKDNYPANRYSIDTVKVECPWCLATTNFYWGSLINRCRECGMTINEEDLYNNVI